jgi:pteridine reductase
MIDTSPQPLAGKSVLITGGARRVGAEIARTLHAAGAEIVIHYRSSAQDAEVLDLLDVGNLPELAERAASAFGRLDVLVNNASTFYPTPVGEITERHWDDLLGSNLKAPLFLSQAAVPYLRASRGLILNMVDIHGMRPLRAHTTYSVAKAGLVMLTRSLARELGPDIRVNGIAPGPVMWPESGADPALREKIIDRTQLKRMGSPQDVALAARYFAADAPFVTGQILAVDGGRSVGW